MTRKETRTLLASRAMKRMESRRNSPKLLHFSQPHPMSVEHKIRQNTYRSKRMKEDVNFRLTRNLRCRLSKAVRASQRGGSAIRDLGCSIDQLKIHLEAGFQPGMTWENWSARGWHIDHIRPLASFDLSDPEQVRVACHYTNLQPLWANDNWSKNAKR